MGCCLSTEYQVDLVIGQFSKYYAPFEQLRPDPFPQLVAGRIVNVDNLLIAPVSGRKCVFYSVKAEELVHKTRRVKDKKGGHKIQHYTEWTYRYKDKRKSDFILVDPGNPSIYVYIPFSQTGLKVHSEKDCKAIRFDSGAACSPHMQDMRGRYQFQHQNEWRYTEQCFEYGEEAAVIGIIKDASVQGGKMLGPMTKDMLTEEYFTNNEWSRLEKASWNDLTKTPTIVVTDCAKFLMNRSIAPLLPPYNVPPTFQVPMYIPGYNPTPVMGIGNNQVYPQQDFVLTPQSGYPAQNGVSETQNGEYQQQNHFS